MYIARWVIESIVHVMKLFVMVHSVQYCLICKEGIRNGMTNDWSDNVASLADDTAEIVTSELSARAHSV